LFLLAWQAVMRVLKYCRAGARLVLDRGRRAGHLRIRVCLGRKAPKDRKALRALQGQLEQLALRVQPGRRGLLVLLAARARLDHKALRALQGQLEQLALRVQPGRRGLLVLLAARARLDHKGRRALQGQLEQLALRVQPGRRGLLVLLAARARLDHKGRRDHRARRAQPGRTELMRKCDGWARGRRATATLWAIWSGTQAARIGPTPRSQVARPMRQTVCPRGMFSRSVVAPGLLVRRGLRGLRELREQPAQLVRRGQLARRDWVRACPSRRPFATAK
jgi:hypothetical protein